MLEISGIQLLGVVLILAFFFLVFKIIEINWSYKMREGAFQEEMEEEETAEKISFSPLNGKELKLIPMEAIARESIADPGAGFSAREVAFTMEENSEEEIELGRAL